MKVGNNRWEWWMDGPSGEVMQFVHARRPRSNTNLLRRNGGIAGLLANGCLYTDGATMVIGVSSFGGFHIYVNGRRKNPFYAGMVADV